MLAQVSVYEAKTQLSQLLEKVVKGESFVIAEDGKPIAMVSAIEPSKAPKKRTGFLAGKIKVPEDFDTMGQAEMTTMFYYQ